MAWDIIEFMATENEAWDYIIIYLTLYDCLLAKF